MIKTNKRVEMDEENRLFTKLRIKKTTITKLNKVKSAQEVEDGIPKYLYILIDELADRELSKISK